jgi:hypothetical protein
MTPDRPGMSALTVAFHGNRGEGDGTTPSAIYPSSALTSLIDTALRTIRPSVSRKSVPHDPCRPRTP